MGSFFFFWWYFCIIVNKCNDVFLDATVSFQNLCVPVWPFRLSALFLRAVGRRCLCCSLNKSLLTVSGRILVRDTALLKIKLAFSKDLGFVKPLQMLSPLKID